MEYSDEEVGQIVAIKRKLMGQGVEMGINFSEFDGDDMDKTVGDILEEIYEMIDTIAASWPITSLIS